jgi:hypothetical protein
MVRGKWALTGAALVLALVSGCCFRDRPGLLARFRGQSGQPDYHNMGNGYGVPMGVPMSMPNGGGCPCETIPGGFNGAGMEFMPPAFPGTTMPPLITPPPGNGAAPGAAPPGSATPRPADPSEPTGLRKNNGVPVSKPGAMQ